MPIIPGRIVAGQVVVEGDLLDEEQNADEDGRITLTPAEEAELTQRLAAMDRGEFAEYESAETFIRLLRARRCGGPR
jgi:hypothetical protein